MDWASHMRRILSQLGENVTFTHAAGSPATVRGVFLNQYLAAQLGDVGFTGTDPVFSTMSADLGAVSVGDVLVRSSTTYKVKAARPDDPSGIVHLELKRT